MQSIPVAVVLSTVVTALLSTACGSFDHHRDEDKNKHLTDENNHLRTSLAQEEQAKNDADAKTASTTAALVGAKDDAAHAEQEAKAAQAAKDLAAAALTAASHDKDAALLEQAAAAKQVQALTAQLAGQQLRADTATANLEHFRTRLATALPDHPELTGDHWPDRVMASIDHLIATGDVDVLEQLRSRLKAALDLPADAPDDALIRKINALQTAADQEKAALVALQQQLDDQSKKLTETAATLAKDITAALAPFAGIWVADGLSQGILPTGCHLLVRVSSGPNQLNQLNQVVRAVLCPNGNLETSTFTVANVAAEASPFPGGVQFTTELTAAGTSCSAAQASTVGAQGGLSFDLKTSTGGEAATYAYSSIGGQPMSFRSGAGLTELKRTKGCDKLQSMAAAPGADPLLVMAAKVCAVETQATGCFTKDGFVAQPTP